MITKTITKENNVENNKERRKGIAVVSAKAESWLIQCHPMWND